MIDQKPYKAHRVAWLHYYGEWPGLQIDHINRDKADNRIANLRLADNGENRQNNDRAQRNNKLGVRGVSKSGNRFDAKICINYKRIILGYFDTIEEASQAYQNARRELHPFSPDAN